jgi:hypothetical protein
MEVSAKGGGWGGGQQDEGGRWVGVGRSFPKKLGVRGGPKIKGAEENIYILTK